MSNTELDSFRLKTERGKTFFFDLMANSNGRFLKITESRPREGGDNSFIRNFMTVPEEYLQEFLSYLREANSYFKNGDEINAEQ